MAVREDRILPVLDEWLVGLFAPEHLNALAEQIIEADQAANHRAPAVEQARRTIAEARRKLERHMAGLEAGVDPELVAERTRKAQAEILAAQAILNTPPDAPPPLTIEEVVTTLEALHNVPRLLEAADPAIRAQIYRSLGITLTYRREGTAEYVQVHAQIGGVDLDRVGGGTHAGGPRSPAAERALQIKSDELPLSVAACGPSSESRSDGRPGGQPPGRDRSQPVQDPRLRDRNDWAINGEKWA
jgi:hypothetical protein